MHPLLMYSYQLGTGQIASELPRLKGHAFAGMLPFMHEHGMLALTDKAYEVASPHEHHAVSFWLATLPIVFMMDKRHVQHTLHSERDQATTRGKALEGLEVAIGEGNVFSMHNNSTWDTLRKAHAKVFLNNDSLDSFFPTLQSEIHDHLQSHQNKELDLVECFVHLTMKVVTKTTLGMTHTLSAEEATELSQAITDVFVQITEPMNLAWHTLNKQLKALGVPNISTPLTHSAEQLQSSIQKNIIEAHDTQAIPSKETIDWIEHMRAMHPDNPDAVLRDVSMVFLAGHETTSRLATFLLVLLKQHPEALSAIQQELASKGTSAASMTRNDFNKCHYLRACVAETLRLYPPVPLIAREVLKPLVYETPGATQPTFEIQAGTLILMSSYHLHRDENNFPDPLTFKPERFLNEQGIFQPKDLDDGYMPFGNGPRDCVGRRFAILEAMAITAQIVTQFDLEAINMQAPLEVFIPGTLKPKDPVRFTLKTS